MPLRPRGQAVLWAEGAPAPCRFFAARRALATGSLLLALLFSTCSCSPSAEAPPGDKPGTQAPGTAPGQTKSSTPPPGASLTEQVQALFNTLREAQLKKDLNLFLSCYSPGFPGLADKREQTRKAWEDFTFTNMFYFLDEVQPLGPDQAMVRVTWELQAQDRRTQETLSATQTFRVDLKREGGTWRIIGLEENTAP